MKHQIWNFGGQLYARIGTRPHIRQDGTVTELIVWRTHCADCGELFQTQSSTSTTPSLNRRCERHRAARRKVKKHVLWGKPAPLAELLGETPVAFSTKSRKRVATAFLADPRRHPDHINPQEEEYGY